MKNILKLTLICAIIIISSDTDLLNAQSLELKENTVFLNGSELRKKDLKQKLISHKEVYNLYRKAKVQYNAGNSLQLISFGLVVARFIVFIKETDEPSSNIRRMNLPLLSGSLIYLAGTGFKLGYKKKMKNVISMYNEEISKNQNHGYQPSYEVGFMQNGIGVIISF